MERVYWNSKRHIGVIINEFSGKSELTCLLNEDAWIDNSEGDGGYDFEVSFPRSGNDGLDPYIRELESGRNIGESLKDWYFEQIFERLNAWAWLTDPECPI